MHSPVPTRSRRAPAARLARRAAALLLPLALGPSVLACGGAEGDSGGRPTVVVTTSVLGDVVRNLVGGDADVEVVIPAGADPHEFAPSAKQIVALRGADVIIANGAGFEPGLTDALEAAEDDGATVMEVIESVDPIRTGDDVDPHFFTDPARMAVAGRAILDHLTASIERLDTEQFRGDAENYLVRLTQLDTTVEQILAVVPDDRRKLVTNHDVFTYFADRYRFEVVGAVIPGGGTGSEPSAGALADLATTIADEGVPAIFADASSPTKLADALADEVGAEVEVVELYTESLQPDDPDGDSYVDMVTANARRIADALD